MYEEISKERETFLADTTVVDLSNTASSEQKF